MHHQEIEQSIMEVTRAIESLNRVFEKRADDLRKAGDADQLQQWTKACQAMRDSGNIYITWARHYARSSEPTAPSEEEDDFLNEGTVRDEPPAGP
ncbi:MAG: hypothetical protein HY204_02180 [Nitrospirae bacterium]|nr:hypothetical protein [Nitrospirota bacterium]